MTSKMTKSVTIKTSAHELRACQVWGDFCSAQKSMKWFDECSFDKKEHKTIELTVRSPNDDLWIVVKQVLDCRIMDMERIQKEFDAGLLD